MPILLASAFGAAIALTVWSLREALVRRFEKDVGWLQHMVWRFTPEPFPAERYVAMLYAGAVALLFLLLLLVEPIAAVGCWTIVVVLPRLFLARAWAKRRKTINEQLPAAVRQMSSGVGSGLSLAQAIERLALRAATPIRTEFHIMANYWKLGADFSSTIEEAKRRLDLPNFNLFASALVVNQRMGGNITETLDRLAGSLESIEQMRRDVHAATSEGRTNIKVLAITPLIMVGMISLMDAGAVKMLFTTPVGHLLLLIAVLLTALGTWWAWTIVRSDV